MHTERLEPPAHHQGSANGRDSNGGGSRCLGSAPSLPWVSPAKGKLEAVATPLGTLQETMVSELGGGVGDQKVWKLKGTLGFGV